MIKKYSQFFEKASADMWNDLYGKIGTGKYTFSKPDENIDKISYNKSGKVLDIGIGDMSNSKYLYKKGFDVYGIDISEIAVDKAKKEIPEGHWIEHDLTEGHLPFNDNMFDVVFSRLSLHYFDNETTMKILDDFCRVLKRDGLLFVSVKIANIGNINTGKVMRTTDEWIKMIEKKFEVTEYEEIVKKPYEFYFIKPLYNFFI